MLHTKLNLRCVSSPIDNGIKGERPNAKKSIVNVDLGVSKNNGTPKSSIKK